MERAGGESNRPIAPLDRRRTRLAEARRHARTFRALTVAVGLAVVGFLLAIVLELVHVASSSIVTNGPGFLIGRTWDPVHNVYGALPGILGTLETSALALLIAVPSHWGSPSS